MRRRNRDPARAGDELRRVAAQDRIRGATGLGGSHDRSTRPRARPAGAPRRGRQPRDPGDGRDRRRAGGAGLGAGCRDHVVRWTVRVASRAGDCCHEIDVEDCPDSSTTGTTTSTAIGPARAGRAEAPLPERDQVEEVWRRVLQANLRYYEAVGRLSVDYVRAVAGAVGSLAAHPAPPRQGAAGRRRPRAGQRAGARARGRGRRDRLGGVRRGEPLSEGMSSPVVASAFAGPKGTSFARSWHSSPRWSSSPPASRCRCGWWPPSTRPWRPASATGERSRCRASVGRGLSIVVRRRRLEGAHRAAHPPSRRSTASPRPKANDGPRRAAEAVGGALLAGAMWSYAASVLYPTQALKRAGVPLSGAVSATSRSGCPARPRSALLAPARPRRSSSRARRSTTTWSRSSIGWPRRTGVRAALLPADLRRGAGGAPRYIGPDARVLDTGCGPGRSSSASRDSSRRARSWGSTWPPGWCKARIGPPGRRGWTTARSSRPTWAAPAHVHGWIRPDLQLPRPPPLPGAGAAAARCCAACDPGASTAWSTRARRGSTA